MGIFPIGISFVITDNQVIYSNKIDRHKIAFHIYNTFCMPYEFSIVFTNGKLFQIVKPIRKLKFDICG
jgi:hypothetical protein